VALGHQIVPVSFGARALDSATYYNKRAEMWGLMKSWLEAGAEIPDDNELCEDLTVLEFSYTVKEQIQLEKKADLRKRGLRSPDCGDSLAITFAEPVYLSERGSFEPEEDFFE
jgi:hypothetical protein